MPIHSAHIPRLTFIAIASLASSSELGGQASRQFSFAKPDWTTTQSFTQIGSVRELSNGNVIVSDYADIAVHMLDATGRIVSAIGRKGSGPAEYLFPLRLVALPNDTTLVVDRDARKFLLVDGRGKIVVSHPFPVELSDGAEFIRGADAAGRLIFRGSMFAPKGGRATSAAIARWKRGTTLVDSLTTIALETSGGSLIKSAGLPKGAKIYGRANVRFAAVDDWAVGATGRVAIIRATPYRVDWVEPDRTIKRGVAVEYQPVPVIEADKKRFEPKGPPYVRTYAKVKSPFISESAVVDTDDNVWVARNEPFASTTRQWDVFDASGRPAGSVKLPADRTLRAVTKRYAYLARTDDDGLVWLERYPRDAASTSTRK